MLPAMDLAATLFVVNDCLRRFATGLGTAEDAEQLGQQLRALAGPAQCGAAPNGTADRASDVADASLDTRRGRPTAKD